MQYCAGVLQRVLPHMTRRFAGVVASLATTLAVFVWLDRTIGAAESGGPYRTEILRPIRAVQQAKNAEHAVLGCSTSNWFPHALRKAWRVDASAIVDAHMSDCHQTCTMAEARHLHRLGHHFRTATFGVNSFEYCEKYRERRVMQEVELLPLSETLELARIYAHGDEPLRYAGGWFMNHVSQVYGNTMWLQRHFRKRWFGRESPDREWYTPPRAAEKSRNEGGFRCDYEGADRDYGLAATRGALRSLELLADRVHLVLLPDRVYAEDTPDARRVRELFLLEHQRLLREFERVELIDLQGGELAARSLFRDGAHLKNKGVTLASKMLARRLPPLPEQGPAAGLQNPSDASQP